MRLLFFVLFLFSTSIFAHPIEPTKTHISFNKDGSFDLAFEINMEAKLAGIGIKHKDSNDSPQALEYNSLRTMPPSQLMAKAKQLEAKLVKGMLLKFDNEAAPLTLKSIDIPEIGNLKLARTTILTYSGQIPKIATQATWRLTSDYRGNMVYMTNEGEENKFFEWTNGGATTAPFTLNERVEQKSHASIAGEYTLLGFEHILPLGLDHILFVIGLFLLSQRWKPLLLQVTAFTVAHSVTLALTILGYISLSATVIEAIIALSIVYIAIENIVTKTLHSWRIVIVFLFGLLHGMGFASVLTNLGLPDYALTTALLSFNIGVELGQLAIITIAFGLTYAVLEKPWFRQRVVIPTSLLIAVIGLYWTWERILG